LDAEQQTHRREGGLRDRQAIGCETGRQVAERQTGRWLRDRQAGG
jgi:hypothetical protein